MIFANDTIVKLGEEFNPLSIVTAYDKEDKDLTSSIEVIENNSPDIVILNLFMPRIDAIGIMTTIRRNRKIEMPMFIVVSSFGRFGLEKEVLDAGASCFVVKPITTAQLVEKIFRINYKVVRLIAFGFVNALNKRFNHVKAPFIRQ